MGKAAASLFLCAGLAALPAHAQIATPAPASKPGQPATVEGVTVTATPNAVQTSIDRRSYSVANDLQATSGSVADVLRNVPSVSVDVQGNVSVRGDGVTILVDGKRSAEFSGGNAAAALQSLPANQIDRVEVITNPSAAMNPEGGAVINLISKQARGEGYSGQIRAGYGDRGQYNLGVTGGYNSRALSLSGDVTARRFREDFSALNFRTTAGAGGAPVDSSQLQRVSVGYDMINARGSLTYDADAATRLTAGFRAGRFTPEGGQDFTYAPTAGGGLTPSFSYRTILDGGNTNGEVNAGYRRKFAGEAHDLAIDLRRSGFKRDDIDNNVYRLGAPAAGPYERVANNYQSTATDLKAEYKRPLPGETKLVVGYQHDIDGSEYDYWTRRGQTPSTLVVVPERTNRFDYDQVLDAAYATYQRPFGDLTVLAGLRAESVVTKTFLHNTGERNRRSYVEAYPSLHLTYDLENEAKLGASYSRRVQRPSPFDVNPLIQYDGTTQRRGNPDIEPQIIDSFEASYERRIGQRFHSATLYYRESQNGFTNVYEDLGGGILLITRENLAQSKVAGLELASSGRLTPRLTYNLSADVFETEIAAPNLGFFDRRSGTAISGRGNLDWQPTPNDFVQIGVNAFGKRLQPQGYVTPAGSVNLGYRRKLSERAFFTVTARDVLKTSGNEVIIDTPALKSTTYNIPSLRSITLGFTYALGATARTRAPGFEFEG